jgi:hypothetical protein
MAATESLTASIDRVIEYFNARRMDLPDGFFDRKTQFVINGAPFETLLGQSPTDPLILMLARGPAGYRFTAKALQHAIPDARIERLDIDDRRPQEGAAATKMSLSGTLRGSGEALNTAVSVILRLAEEGTVAVAEATVDPADLDKIRQARLQP